jgi:hydroxymethylbilane synthase
MTVRSIRIATRSSRLALWQAEHVRGLLNAVAPDVPVEIIHVSTLGDRDLSAPLSSLGAFGVFTREVQRVVLDDKADLAVHSLKDLPTDHVENLCLGAVPERGPVFDTLVLPANAAAGLNWESLPKNARLGTGSLRRQAQLLHARPDLQLLEIRGNVETRLRKLDAGEFDAIVLAVAGLERLGLAGRITQPLPPPVMFPAVGQGALGLECRADDNWLRDILVRISDPATFAAVIAERALLAELRAGCHAPLGVATSLNGDQLTLDAVVLSPDGVSRIHASLSRPVTAPAELGRTVAGLLREQGADALIAAAKQSPP